MDNTDYPVLNMDYQDHPVLNMDYLDHPVLNIYHLDLTEITLRVLYHPVLMQSFLPGTTVLQVYTQIPPSPSCTTAVVTKWRYRERTKASHSKFL